MNNCALRRCITISSKPLTDKEGEVREPDRDNIRRMKPLRDVLPELAAAYRTSRGRPAGRTKEVVHLSLDIDLINALRKTGRGWQARANALLRKGMNLTSPSRKKGRV